MKQLTSMARNVYIVLMVAATVLDALLALWLFTDASSGLGVGFLVTGAWIALVAVHVLVHAVADSTPVTRSHPTMSG
jgi:uncharacterized membrane protein